MGKPADAARAARSRAQRQERIPGLANHLMGGRAEKALVPRPSRVLRFARSLNTDWPGRIRPILSIPDPAPTLGTGATVDCSSGEVEHEAALAARAHQTGVSSGTARALTNSTTPPAYRRRHRNRSHRSLRPRCAHLSRRLSRPLEARDTTASHGCCAQGSSRKKVVPSPGVDSTRILPLSASTQSATIERPKPRPLVPSWWSRPACPR